MSFTRAKSAGWTDNVDPITAAQINQIDVNQSRAVDGNAGGTYTPSAVITIEGTEGFKINGSGAAARLKYGSRTITRVTGAPIYNSTTSVTSVASANLAASDIAFVGLDRMPNGATLASATIYHNRADGSPLPGTTRVQVSLNKTNVTTGVATAIVALTQDPVSTLPAYQEIHGITLTPGVAEVIDTTAYVYWLRIEGETGANATTTVIYPPLVSLTITDQDEAP